MKTKMAKKKPGRPPKGGQQYNVKLTDEVADRARIIGEGQLTRGIERAVIACKCRKSE